MSRQTFAAAAMLALLGTTSAEAFEFKDGDRVVLIGGTLIEREQRYGYWEAALTARNPDKNITFRNLGWSGDTVWGEARAEFGTVAEGYQHLVEHVRAEKPTVILVGYGTNESFAGPEGLPKFKAQLTKLLDDLSTTRARFVLLSPMKMVKMPPPLPDPAKANENLKLYGEAIREEAQRRPADFVDLYACDLQGLTDNGQHLTAHGYWATTDLIATALDSPAGQRRFFQIIRGPSEPRRFALSFRLPVLYEESRTASKASLSIRFDRLDHGSYTLKVDGKELMTCTESLWARGQPLHRGNRDHDQAEKLRQAIIAKNELYFHRWRPQNVTYLFGFRKHEQGNNAREIPQFDPLVEAKEKEIAKLRKPVEHVYELVPVKAEKK